MVHYTGVTAALDPPVTPDYKRINVEVPGEPVTAHIESVRYGYDVSKGEYDIVDGNYETSWARIDWDSGATYYDLKKAPIVSFDRSYEMDTMVVIPDGEQTFSYNKAVLYYWTDRNDIQDSTKNSVSGVLEKKTSNNKAYYEFRADRPIEAEAVQLVLSTADGNSRRISMAELKFYYYDSLEDEIMDLYGDPYHVSLRPDVDRETMGKGPAGPAGSGQRGAAPQEGDPGNGAGQRRADPKGRRAPGGDPGGGQQGYRKLRQPHHLQGRSQYVPAPGRDRKGRGDGHRLCGKPRP